MSEREPTVLSGRRALVTAGSTGIGAACAIALAAAGADVAITFRSRGQLANLLGRVAEVSGREPFAVEMELRSVDSIQRAVGEATAALGGIDILVNSAGINVPQPALDVDEATWDEIVDANLKGTFFTCQAVARVMVAGPTPSEPSDARAIVNVASQMGLVGFWNRAAYCASKAGVVNLTRALAIEWAQYGIRVNAVAPTFIETPLGAKVLGDPEVRADALSRIPMGRLGTPEEVASAVVFLAGAGASIVTGHTLAVDGGWTAQ